MTRKELFDGVQDIFRDIFDEDDMVIEDKTSSDDIEDWDSLNHINLVVSAEKLFDIRLALGEIAELQNVGDFVHTIQNKLR